MFPVILEFELKKTIHHQFTTELVYLICRDNVVEDWTLDSDCGSSEGSPGRSVSGGQAGPSVCLARLRTHCVLSYVLLCVRHTWPLRLLDPIFSPHRRSLARTACRILISTRPCHLTKYCSSQFVSHAGYGVNFDSNS